MLSVSRRQALMSLAAGAVAVGPALMLASPGFAKGNLASNPVRLPELKIDTVHLKYTPTSYTLETGKYYFWKVTCDAEVEDIALVAPKLFANSWINQIVAGDIDIHTTSVDSIEFDDAATFEIQFVPLRPGQYEYYTPGYENRGLKGEILVN